MTEDVLSEDDGLPAFLSPRISPHEESETTSRSHSRWRHSCANWIGVLAPAGAAALMLACIVVFSTDELKSRASGVSMYGDEFYLRLAFADRLPRGLFFPLATEENVSSQAVVIPPQQVAAEIPKEVATEVPKEILKEVPKEMPGVLLDSNQFEATTLASPVDAFSVMHAVAPPKTETAAIETAEIATPEVVALKPVSRVRPVAQRPVSNPTGSAVAAIKYTPAMGLSAKTKPAQQFNFFSNNASPYEAPEDIRSGFRSEYGQLGR